MPMDTNPAAMLVQELSNHHRMVDQVIKQLNNIYDRVRNRNPQWYDYEDMQDLQDDLIHVSNNWINNIFPMQSRIKAELKAEMLDIITFTIQTGDNFMEELNEPETWVYNEHDQMFKHARNHQYSQVKNQWFRQYITHAMKMEDLVMTTYQHTGHSEHLNLNIPENQPSIWGIND